MSLLLAGVPQGALRALGWEDNKPVCCFAKKKGSHGFISVNHYYPTGIKFSKKLASGIKLNPPGFIKKYGANFTLPDNSKTVRNVFSEGLVKNLNYTFQVERSRFDKILLDHAEKSGCKVHQRHRICNVTRRLKGWLVEIEDLDSGEKRIVSTQWILDASGRSCVMGRELKIKKEPIPYPGRFAVFNHFNNVKRKGGQEGGDIIVLRFEDAWFWMIPISKTITSIGVVAQQGFRSQHKGTLEAFFWDKIRESSFLSNALACASTKDPYRSESDYCFSYDRFGTNRVLLAGDAASFIDPVFSSGVYLALESGLLSAKTIGYALTSDIESVPEKTYSHYTQTMKQRILTIRKLIEAYYNNKDFEVFMEPRPKFKIPQAINSILAGSTLPPWRVRWRYWLFQKICHIHKKLPLVPEIKWKSVSKKPKSQPIKAQSP